MIGAWIVGSLLMGCASWYALHWWRRGRAAQRDAVSLSVALYRDAMAPLDADLAKGKLAPSRYKAAKRVLERRLLDGVMAAPTKSTGLRGGRGAMLALSVALPLLAVVSYLRLDNPGATEPATSNIVSVKPGQSPSAKRGLTLAEQLTQRLLLNPDSARGWVELARANTGLKRHADAVEAYAKAALLLPNDAQLLAEYAEAAALANDRNLSGKPMELLQTALAIDPRHQRALALAGTAALNAGQYSVAIGYWQRLRDQLPPDAQNAKRLDAMMAQARDAAGVPQQR